MSLHTCISCFKEALRVSKSRRDDDDVGRCFTSLSSLLLLFSLSTLGGLSCDCCRRRCTCRCCCSCDSVWISSPPTTVLGGSFPLWCCCGTAIRAGVDSTTTISSASWSPNWSEARRRALIWEKSDGEGGGGAVFGVVLLSSSLLLLLLFTWTPRSVSVFSTDVAAVVVTGTVVVDAAFMRMLMARWIKSCGVALWAGATIQSISFSCNRRGMSSGRRRLRVSIHDKDVVVGGRFSSSVVSTTAKRLAWLLRKT
mmetsp:Transcript_17267/g.40069  ORF Transcript_17267/g.40069 Transcript_17267/m.40069 type:complete len:254 (-) Transcript_17267:1007-1768(-)